MNFVHVLSPVFFEGELLITSINGAQMFVNRVTSPNRYAMNFEHVFSPVFFVGELLITSINGA